jgi:hypothetical protein
MSGTPEEHDRWIEIWSKAIDTQMHFNEMSAKSRQLGLAFVAAALGVAVVLISRGNDYALDIPLDRPLLRIHVAVLIVLAAFVALWAVRTLDVNVYHKMLRGAVAFGEDFEEHYMKQIFELEKGMTQAISHFSRKEDAKARIHPETKRMVYSCDGERTALQKIEAFYSRALWFLGLTALALLLLTNASLWLQSPLPTARPLQSVPSALAGGAGAIAPTTAAPPAGESQQPVPRPTMTGGPPPANATAGERGSTGASVKPSVGVPTSEAQPTPGLSGRMGTK